MRLDLSSIRVLTLNIFVVLALLLPIRETRAAIELVPHNAQYAVVISVAKGSMATNLEKTDAGYTASSLVRPRGWARIFVNGRIEGRSNFLLTGSGVQPTGFSQTDTISSDDEVTALHFDWTLMRLLGKVTYQENRKTHENVIDEEIHTGTFDPISLQYALMHDLITDNLQSEYILADGDEQKVINIRRLEETRITVPFGDYAVIPIQHQAESSSRVTTFWFAPALNYLPVKIEQYKGDKRQMVAVLSDYRVPPYK